LTAIFHVSDTLWVLIDWTDDFDAMLDTLEARAAAGDQHSADTRLLIDQQLAYLQRLTTPPTDETPTLKRVRQSRRHPIWRVAHPYRPGIAVRTIVWFPDAEHVVVALFANDKAQMGDVFYDSAGTRADQIIDRWLRERNTP